MRAESDIDEKTLGAYLLLIFAMCIILVIALSLGKNVTTHIFFLITIIFAMWIGTRGVHIPPAMMIFLLAISSVSLISQIYSDHPILHVFQDVLTGIVIGLVSLIISYAFLREIPGAEKERTALVALMSFLVGVAIFTLWETAVHFIYPDEERLFMETFIWVMSGLLMTSTVFFAGYSTRLFDATVIRFLKKNSDAIGIISISETDYVMELVAQGESEVLEFKATLRTNLATGEKDKRMERAVLKTLVAFMNTNGGTLLIGVGDDGSIAGVDEESFENRDRMCLHLTHMISNQIGNQFLPFITFKIVPFGNVCIIRIVCTSVNKPVFLNDTNSDSYFVRSGPSSIELTGMNLLNYVENRKKN